MFVAIPSGSWERIYVTFLHLCEYNVVFDTQDPILHSILGRFS